MYDRVLLPLDGSELAESVLPYVLPLAKRFGSEVILLQVVSPLSKLVVQALPTGMTPAGGAQVSVQAAQAQQQEEIKSAQEYLNAARERFKGEGIKTQTQVLEGEVATAILEYANEMNVSLIAMSTHGRSGLARTIFGSVADEVLRTSHLPLLIVRPKE